MQKPMEHGKNMNIFSLTTVAALVCLTGWLTGSPAMAQEPAEGTTAENLGTRVGVRAVPLKLASLIAPGEIPDQGDWISIQRPYGPWVLNCDIRPSANKRICSSEQIVRSQNNAFVWRIALTDDFTPVVVFSFPPQLDVESGLRLGFSDLEKTVIGNEWSCGDRGCIASFPFSGFVQAAILNTGTMQFSYRLKTSADPVEVKATSSMDGFTATLDAAANDPFAKAVPVKAGPVKPSKKTEVKPDSASRKPVQKIDQEETASVPTPPNPAAEERAKALAAKRPADKQLSGPESTSTKPTTPRQGVLY